MFGRVKKRKKNLASTLEMDLTQPLGWDSWLGSSKSIKELHQSCPHPGWLTYCAYWHKVSQDALMEGAHTLAIAAAMRDPRSAVSEEIAGRLAIESWSWPDLAELVVSVERRYPVAGSLVAALPTQYCNGIMEIDNERLVAGLAREADDAPDISPYRADPTSQIRDDIDGIVAAGFVCVMEAMCFRWDGLREGLAIRAAAAASLLSGSYKGFADEALAELHRLYKI